MINAEELIQRINEQIENFGWDDFGTGWKSACSTIILIVEDMDKENRKEHSTREEPDVELIKSIIDFTCKELKIRDTPKSPKMVKYANKWYQVIGAKNDGDGIWYTVEDEHNNVDWISENQIEDYK